MGWCGLGGGRLLRRIELVGWVFTGTYMVVVVVRWGLVLGDCLGVSS
jgi:hypothetical protein